MKWCGEHTTEIKVFALFTLLSAVVLMLISPDAPTHDLYGRCDSAWFFMCGKAWMNGLVPYVDFADSKGPLLWLIYGAGYLISHGDYVGVYALSVLWYGAIFYVVYRIGLLYSPSRRVAVLAAVVMSVPLFNPLVRYETRAEDFALLFVAVSYYVSARVVRNGFSGMSLRRAALMVGAATGALAMIKYNLAVWNGIFWLWLLYASWRRRSGGVRCIAWLLLGTSAAIAPFAAVLAVQGCLDDCVREYVINAASTVSRVENSIFGWPVKASVAVTALLVPAGIALCPMARREKLLHLSAFAVFFFSFFVSSRYAYNFALTGIFFIPLAVWTASLCRSWAARSPVLALLCLLVLLCCTGSNLYLNGRKTSLQRFPTLFWPDSHARSNFRYVSGLMQRVPHPRVCYMECYPQPEFGVAAQALPACKYWAAQNGRTTEMAQSQWNDCKAMKPDFIVALPQYDDVAQKIDTLKALGYIEHSLPYPDESGHKLDYIILEKPRE